MNLYFPLWKVLYQMHLIRTAFLSRQDIFILFFYKLLHNIDIYKYVTYHFLNNSLILKLFPHFMHTESFFFGLIPQRGDAAVFVSCHSVIRNILYIKIPPESLKAYCESITQRSCVSCPTESQPFSRQPDCLSSLATLHKAALCLPALQIGLPSIPFQAFKIGMIIVLSGWKEGYGYSLFSRGEKTFLCSPYHCTLLSSKCCPGAAQLLYRHLWDHLNMLK